MLLIGTDEAGYGPNLGPLVVTATVWEIPDGVSEDLYEVLAAGITAEPCVGDDPRLRIGDSKALYRSGGGILSLETMTLAALAACSAVRHRGVSSRLISSRIASSRIASSRLVSCHADAASVPQREAAGGPDRDSLGDSSFRLGCWAELCQALAESLAASDELPWHREVEIELPLEADPAEIQRLAELWEQTLKAAEIRLHDVRSRVVFPSEWNRLVEADSSKGQALSRVTLDLVAAALAEQPRARHTLIHCDKHGGRNKYGSLLQQLFPEYLVEVRRESTASSIYQWGPPGCRMEARFVAKGDTRLPSALASMVSKYAREVSMRVFNAYWRNYLPGLQPTAGYPRDAIRFRRAIADIQKQLKLPDHLLWREK